MRRPERRVDDAAAVGDQPHVGVVQAEVDGDLLEAAPGEERRDRVDVDDLALEREAGRHADDVGFADAFHEEAVGDLLLELVERADAEVRADEHDPLVLLGELVDHVEAVLAHQRASSAASSRSASCAVTLFL